MVVSITQFNEAMTEINASYAKLFARVEALEAEVKELKSGSQTKTKAPVKSAA